MFQYLYEWMVNAAFYLVVFTAVIQLLPNGTYQKYVRFFTGLVLVVLILTPAFRILGMEQGFRELYDSSRYEQEKKEIEESARFLEDTEFQDFLPEDFEDPEEEKEEDEVHVEEIRIGE